MAMIDLHSKIDGKESCETCTGGLKEGAVDARDPAAGAVHKQKSTECGSFVGKRTMISLELTDQEARNLESALARRVRDMMQELVHTEDRTAHAELKSTYEELDRLHRRVAGLIVPGPSRRDAKGPAT